MTDYFEALAARLEARNAGWLLFNEAATAIRDLDAKFSRCFEAWERNIATLDRVRALNLPLCHECDAYDQLEEALEPPQ